MTGHVNDHKLSALQSLLSISGGNIDDLEAAWLISEASNFGNPNDMWLQVFQSNGASSDNFNTAASEFLVASGFSGGYNQMWHDYWEAGGGIPVGAQLVYDTFTDTNGTSLVAHSANMEIDTVGGGWSTLVGSPNIQSNALTDSTDAVVTLSYIDAGEADVTVTADFRTYKGAEGTAGSALSLRITDTNNYWLFGVLTFSTDPWSWGISEINGGVFTNRASAQGLTTGGNATLNSTMIGAGSGQTVTFDVAGEGISLSYGGATLNQAVTTHGIRGFNNSLPNVKSQWDNYEIVG